MPRLKRIALGKELSPTSTEEPRVFAGHAARGEGDLELVVVHRHGAKLGAETLEAVEKDAHALVTFVHPNVAGVFATLKLKGDVAVVAEWTDGSSLAELREVTGRIPPAIALRIVLDVVEGLIGLTKAGVSVGALVPTDVIVGVDGVTRLACFWLAHARPILSSKIRAIHAAPEVLRGDAPDEGADVFTAGVLAWECLAGKSMFEPESPEEHLVRLEWDEIPRLADTSSEIADIVGRALRLDGEARTPSLATLSRELGACLPIAPREGVGTWVRTVAGGRIGERRSVHDVERKLSLSPAAPPVVAPGPKPDESKPEIPKAGESKPEIPKAGESKPDASKPADSKPEIAKKIDPPKPALKIDPPKPTLKIDPPKPIAAKIDPKPAPKIDPKPAPKIDPKPAPKPAAKIDPKPAPKIEPKPAPKIEAKPEPKPEPKPVPKLEPLIDVDEGEPEEEEKLPGVLIQPKPAPAPPAPIAKPPDSVVELDETEALSIPPSEPLPAGLERKLGEPKPELVDRPARKSVRPPATKRDSVRPKPVEPVKDLSIPPPPPPKKSAAGTIVLSLVMLGIGFAVGFYWPQIAPLVGLAPPPPAPTTSAPTTSATSSVPPPCASATTTPDAATAPDAAGDAGDAGDARIDDDAAMQTATQPNPLFVPMRPKDSGAPDGTYHPSGI